jgi:predicted nucleic acid binding AN1-type Zn finger protein
MCNIIIVEVVTDEEEEDNRDNDDIERKENNKTTIEEVDLSAIESRDSDGEKTTFYVDEDNKETIENDKNTSILSLDLPLTSSSIQDEQDEDDEEDDRRTENNNKGGDKELKRLRKLVKELEEAKQNHLRETLKLENQLQTVQFENEQLKMQLNNGNRNGEVTVSQQWKELEKKLQESMAREKKIALEFQEYKRKAEKEIKESDEFIKTLNLTLLKTQVELKTMKDKYEEEDEVEIIKVTDDKIGRVRSSTSPTISHSNHEHNDSDYCPICTGKFGAMRRKVTGIEHT